MRWMIAAAAVAVAALTIAGCGVRNSVAPPPPVVGSYLGDVAMEFPESQGAQLIANFGLVLRENGIAEGAVFTGSELDAPQFVPNYDAFVSGRWTAAGVEVSGQLIGNKGTEEVGTIRLTCTFAEGSELRGTVSAPVIGTGPSSCRAYFYGSASIFGCYMGTYTGGRSGIIAIMNFPAAPPDYPADTVVMTKEDVPPPHTDYLYGLTADVLTPLPAPGQYALSIASNPESYDTGLVVSGTLGGTSASGVWSQPQDSTPLTGAWSASRPDSRAATRAVPTGPLRVRRVKHKFRSSPVAGHS